MFTKGYKMSQEINVGKEILSHCNKCKLTLAHIIVTMKTLSNPDKVMCKTCKGTHAYKDPSAAKKQPSITSKILKPKTANKRPAGVPIEELWTQAMNKTNTRSKEYTIKGNFEAGDLIAHPTFGPGIVEKVFDANKIEVLFRDDFRTLIHNK
jgi:hypothetical protein